MSDGAGGASLDRAALDRAEQEFWRGIWETVPAHVATEHGIELRRFGPVQATIATDLPEVGMLNLVLGAAEPRAIDDGHLAAALDWVESKSVGCYVPVTPELAGAGTAEAWLSERGYESGYGWMKFARDPHPPRFPEPEGIEVVPLSEGESESFGMIAATGFGLPAWASAFFAGLPGREGWHCYVVQVDDRAQACAAMFIHDGIAEFGIAATLEPARGRGCQLALLHRRIVDAAAAGCHTLFVETGERRPDRPAASYRNILRAGFKEAYLRPNWQRAKS